MKTIKKTQSLTPTPRSAPHGLASKPIRLQRRKACFAKPLFRPASGRGERQGKDGDGHLYKIKMEAA
jgi:hypothetical protein